MDDGVKTESPNASGRGVREECVGRSPHTRNFTCVSLGSTRLGLRLCDYLPMPSCWAF